MKSSLLEFLGDQVIFLAAAFVVAVLALSSAAVNLPLQGPQAGPIMVESISISGNGEPLTF